MAHRGHKSSRTWSYTKASCNLPAAGHETVMVGLTASHLRTRCPAVVGPRQDSIAHPDLPCLARALRLWQWPAIWWWWRRVWRRVWRCVWRCVWRWHGNLIRWWCSSFPGKFYTCPTARCCTEKRGVLRRRWIRRCSLCSIKKLSAHDPN